MDPSTSPQVRNIAKDSTEENDPNDSPNLKERRLKYKCGEKFVTLDNILSWPEYANKYLSTSGSPKIGNYTVNEDFNRKLSLWQGDITALEIDAIVNAANSSLLGGGGVDGAIHSAAGPKLKEYCIRLNGCETGDAKISPGFNLPAKFVIHTVGPIGQNEAKLHSCYNTSLTRLKEEKLRTVAFPCVSTGIYGYPNKEAAHVALHTVRSWLEKDNNYELVDRIIFCLFLKVDVDWYHRLLPLYFPLEPTESDNSSSDDSITKIVSGESSQTVSKQDFFKNAWKEVV